MEDINMAENIKKGRTLTEDSASTVRSSLIQQQRQQIAQMFNQPSKAQQTTNNVGNNTHTQSK